MQLSLVSCKSSFRGNLQKPTLSLSLSLSLSLDNVCIPGNQRHWAALYHRGRPGSLLHGAQIPGRQGQVDRRSGKFNIDKYTGMKAEVLLVTSYWWLGLINVNFSHWPSHILFLFLDLRVCLGRYYYYYYPHPHPSLNGDEILKKKSMLQFNDKEKGAIIISDGNIYGQTDWQNRL